MAIDHCSDEELRNVQQDRELPVCGNPKCGASTNVVEDVSFGHGGLDDYGFWSTPCGVCARAFEAKYPNEEAWPYRPDSPRRQGESK